MLGEFRESEVIGQVRLTSYHYSVVGLEHGGSGWVKPGWANLAESYCNLATVAYTRVNLTGLVWFGWFSWLWHGQPELLYTIYIQVFTVHIVLHG